MVEHWESCECRKCDQKRIADLREENERLRKELRQGRDYQTYIYTIQKRDAEYAALRAEIERLRDALKKIAAVTCHDIRSAVQAWEERGRIAREALRQEGGEE